MSWDANREPRLILCGVPWCRLPVHGDQSPHEPILDTTKIFWADRPSQARSKKRLGPQAQRGFRRPREPWVGLYASVCVQMGHVFDDLYGPTDCARCGQFVETGSRERLIIPRTVYIDKAND